MSRLIRTARQAARYREPDYGTPATRCLYACEHRGNFQHKGSVNVNVNISVSQRTAHQEHLMRALQGEPQGRLERIGFFSWL